MQQSKAIAEAQSNSFTALITHPLKFRAFLLKNLPSAYFSGVRVKAFSAKACSVVVPYKWFSRNPFRSTYFACLAMAAEMSTGVLALANIYRRRPGVSMLVVGLESKFYKKATGKTLFTCNDGAAIANAVATAITTGEAQTIKTVSTGKNEAGELVAEFWITWSFKAKTK